MTTLPLPQTPQNGEVTAHFASMLITWQKSAGRHDLPWQQSRDAYRIWLSEIMLQQTQVGTVIAYYQRFLSRFPDLASLASAPLDAVLALWAGLGYYARARNLHRCAQIVMADYAGTFPDSALALNALPGIGRSTAAAIRAFAFGARAAILDGNVKRVLARCFAIDSELNAATEKTLWALAESLLPTQHIEAYTQGLMDLGSSVCTRHKPRCSVCPMRNVCAANAHGMQAAWPRRKARKTVPEQQTSLLLLSDGQRVLLEQRPHSGIWGGLWVLPSCVPHEMARFAQKHGFELVEARLWQRLKHRFTHFHLHIEVWRAHAIKRHSLAAEAGWQWFDISVLKSAARPALPAPMQRVLDAL